MNDFRRIPCVIQRGGTSKGIFLHEKDLPEDPMAREEVILAIFGSPDSRQIDGLGGADPLTSKVAIIAPSDRADADVDYTFGAVDINEPVVDFRGNCGNISSGVGPFAIDEGIIPATSPETTVRIYNTNTDKVITAYVSVSDGKACYEGDYAIDGVPGTGAKILLDYSGTVGALTGKLLPTGQPVDEVTIPSLGKIKLSMVDAGNPVCFIEPSSLELTGLELPSDGSVLNSLAQIEMIRGIAAEMIGLVGDPAEAKGKSPAMPLLAIVSKPKPYTCTSNDRIIKADDIDITGRVFYMQEMHKTYSVTAAVCTATAAMIPGTLVNRVTSPQTSQARTIRIGHPAGIISIETKMAENQAGFQLEMAALGRTSRRIMDGFVYVRESLF